MVKPISFTPKNVKRRTRTLILNRLLDACRALVVAQSDLEQDPENPTRVTQRNNVVHSIGGLIHEYDDV